MSRSVFRVLGAAVTVAGSLWLAANATADGTMRNLSSHPRGYESVMLDYAEEVRAQSPVRITYDDGRPVAIVPGATGLIEHGKGLEGGAPDAYEHVIGTLEDELAMADGNYTRTCGLRTVRVVEDLHLDGKPYDGAAVMGGTIYIDSLAKDPRAIAVHELNHLCVWSAGEAYRERWQQAGYRYVGDDWHEADAHGYSRPYGAKSWLEDNATIAEDVLLRPEHVARKSQDDEIYSEKVAHVRWLYGLLGDPRFGSAQGDERVHHERYRENEP